MKDNKFSILVIDDEQDVRDALFNGLTRRGYDVAAVASAEEGVERIKKNNLDLVLLDIKLPGMDGVQALEEIKKINPEIEVIMISGHGTVESATLSMKNGAYDFVEKPISIEKIVRSIDKALEKHYLNEKVALYEISKAVFSTIEMDRLLEIIVDSTMKVMRADDASVMLFDENNHLYIAISYGLDEKIKKQTRLAVGERIAGWVAQYREPLILHNGLLNDERFKNIKGREDIKSALVMPLLKNDRLLGILTVNRKQISDNFNRSDLYKASIFASLVSLAIDNANLYTELRVMKEELVQSNNDLVENKEGILKALADLKKANEDLQTSQRQLVQSTKLAALGSLVSDMAHEVNNPLMIISGRAQLSLMEEINNKKLKSNIEIILEESVRAKEVMDRILQFSRPSKCEFKETDINKMIDGLVAIIEHQFGLDGVIIKTNFSKAPLAALIDEKQIQEALLNILNNAKDAVGQKGEIEITALAEGNFARIEIKDSGCGMSAEVLERIFEPFFTTKEKGTGLGLAVCYNIIKSNNGDLKFTSYPGKGTTATIFLPVKGEGAGAK